MSSWRQIRSILALPGVVVVGMPAAILLLARDWRRPGPLALAAAAASAGAGLALMAQTIRLFATRGEGTLAPWDPPSKLVVRGVYRRVRNPMITGVLLVLLGEVLATGSRALAAWLGGAALVNAIYIPLLEEPGLEARFGEDYRTYRRSVPRWVPRLRPWDPE